MKVPNKVLVTSLKLAAFFNGDKTVAPPAKEDVEFLTKWANEGVTKRTAMAAAPKEEN